MLIKYLNNIREEDIMSNIDELLKTMENVDNTFCVPIFLS